MCGEQVCVVNKYVWRTSMCSESLYMCGETIICIGNAVVYMKNAVEVHRKNRETPNVVVDVKKHGYMHQKCGVISPKDEISGAG